MSNMNFFIGIVIVIIIIYVLAKLFKNFTPPPDPWENEISRDEVDKLEKEICLKCGSEVKNGQYYCPKCNNATGKYVPYLPFVNIQFNYSMHQNLWGKLKSKKLSFIYKAAIILFITLTAPIMLIGHFALTIIKIIKYLFKII